MEKLEAKMEKIVLGSKMNSDKKLFLSTCNYFLYSVATCIEKPMVKVKRNYPAHDGREENIHKMMCKCRCFNENMILMETAYECWGR